jgi:hypothetical protein
MPKVVMLAFVRVLELRIDESVSPLAPVGSMAWFWSINEDDHGTACLICTARFGHA